MAKQRDDRHDDDLPTGPNGSRQNQPSDDDVIDLDEVEVVEDPAAPAREGAPAAPAKPHGDDLGVAAPTSGAPRLSLDDEDEVEVLEVVPVDEPIEAEIVEELLDESAPVAKPVAPSRPATPPPIHVAQPIDDVVEAINADVVKATPVPARPAPTLPPVVPVAAHNDEALTVEPEEVLAGSGRPGEEGLLDDQGGSASRAEEAPPWLAAMPVTGTSGAPARADDADEEPIVLPRSGAAPRDEEVLGAEPVAAEPISGEIVEAMPVSDVVEAMPVSDVVEAQPISDVVIAEAVGSSVRRADSDVVLHEDDAVDFGATAPKDEADASVISKQAIQPVDQPTGDEDVLGAEAEAIGSSAIDWDAVEEAESTSASGTFSQAAAFEPPSKSGSRDDDALVAHEDLTDAEDESSAVRLGEQPSKAKPLSGIDPVAEALESGVNLDEPHTAQAREAPSVEFDEILDEGEPAPELRPARSKQRGGGESGTDELDALPLAGDSGAGRKGKKPASVDDEAAALFGEEAEARPVDDEAEAMPVDDEAEAKPVDDDFGMGEEPSPRKRVLATGDDEPVVAKDEDEKPARKGPRETVPAGRRSLVGSLGLVALGGAVTVGLLAVVTFLAPSVVTDTLHATGAVERPKPAPPAPPPPPPPLAQQARGEMDQGKYDDALALLNEAPEDDKSALSARGEARWLKYLGAQAAGKQPLDPKSPEVVAAEEDLKKADNQAALMQMRQVLQGASLQATAAAGAEAVNTINSIRVALAAAKLAPPNASAKQLTAAITAAVGSKAQSDQLVSGIAQAMVAAKQIEKAEELDAAAVQKFLKDIGGTQAALAAVNKALQDANVKDAGPKGVAELAAARKDYEDKLSEVNKKLKEAGAKDVAELAAAREQTQKELTQLTGVLKATFAELANAGLVPADGDMRKQLVEGAKLARVKSESPLAVPLSHLGSALAAVGTGAARLVDQSAAAGKLASELAYYRAREPFIQSPEQKLDAYIGLLRPRDAGQGHDLSDLAREADWLLGSQKASPEARSKAHYVRGLALRNQEKYPEARKAFEEALAEAAKAKEPGPWVLVAKQALAEIADPRVYYLPQIERYENEGDYKAAMKEINSALKALPGNGTLLAERALIALEVARAERKVAERADAIRKDAEAALKDKAGAADGHYALGQLEEERGNYPEAENHYRDAIKAQTAAGGDVSRYRIALARLLLRDRSALPLSPPAAPKKSDEKQPPAGAEAGVLLHPLAELVLAATVSFQPIPDVGDADPKEEARVKESIQLANDLIASKDAKVRGQGHMLLGQAYARQGKRTEGLKEYSKGLKLVYPGLSTGEMSQMIDEHPAFQQPDVSNRPNPILAERHFGQGMALYWAKRYAEAETQFREAGNLYSNDARYRYFLGLAQLAQKTKLKREAAVLSLEQGARLEAQGRPTVSEIDASLERVQGELRQVVNSYRYRSVAREDK